MTTDGVLRLATRQAMWNEFWDRLLARAANRIEAEETSGYEAEDQEEREVA